ncbi:nose resistant to fluoxetine protein 6-like [Bacillus rossius redtenbacheri]|uniref:nose resistant to fluoxetine protein 6-like n=1 Tax=Bacillus rossius redtenbacheri TaxID=93214 RepID=UPI002FDCF953
MKTPPSSTGRQPSTTWLLLTAWLMLACCRCCCGAAQGSPRLSRTEAVLDLHRLVSAAAEDFWRLGAAPNDSSSAAAAALLAASERCRRQTLAVLEGLASAAPWAAKMADSWGRAPAGMLDGADHSFGDFDECVRVSAPPISGRYCLVGVTLALGGGGGGDHDHGDTRRRLSNGPDGRDLAASRRSRADRLELKVGACVPSGCSHADLESVLGGVVLPRAPRVAVKVPEEACHVGGASAQLRSRDLVFLFSIAAYSVIIIIATAFSLLKRCSVKASLPAKVLLAFSLTENLRKIGKYQPTNEGLDCLFGIKFIFMTLILMGHSSLFQLGGPIVNEEEMYELQMAIHIDPYNNNQLFVDGFLLFGGFLMCLMMLQELDKKKTINFPLAIFLRYFRLTPAYGVVVAFYATVFYHVGSGPLWDSRMGLERDRCLTSWWANLLYVNNYVGTGSMCMFQSWYVAADFHMFLAGLPLVYVIWRWPVTGYTLMALALLASVAANFLSTLLYRLDPLLMMFRPEMDDITLNPYFENIYIKSHFKATPYIVGIVLGCLVHRFRTKGIKLNKAALWSGWAAAGALALCSMFSACTFYRRGYRYRALEAALFAAFDKLGWSAAVSWLIFACATGHGGTLNRLLSYKWIVPFSRVTYSAYLVNGIVILYNLGSTRAPTYVDEYLMTQTSVMYLVMTYSAGLLLTLTFESPLNALQKILLTGRRENSKEERKIESS